MSGNESQRLYRLFAMVGRVDADLAARCLGLAKAWVEEFVAGVEEVVDDGGVLRLAPVTAHDVLSATDDLEEIASLVLDVVLARAGVDRDVVLSLVDAGCADNRLVEPVLHLDATATEEDNPAVMRVHALARRLGWSTEVTALRRAEAMLAEDRLDRCLALCGQVVDSGLEPALSRAVELIAMAEARLGNVGRALEIYRAHQPGSTDAVVAAVSSALGAGSPDDLTAFAELHGAAPTAATGGWSGLFVEGVACSLQDGSSSLAGLVRAAQAVRYAERSSRLLPHTPATLAAAVALGQGDPVVAGTVLEQALAAGVGGEHGRNAHLLGLAWTAMTSGDLDRVGELTDPLDPDTLRNPLQSVLLRTILVGLARRRGDSGALNAAWRGVRGEVLAVPVDLFTLPLLGELQVAGARVGDPSRLDGHLDRAAALLGDLGDPPVWSNLFHWSGVQAAILGQRPEKLRPHASALARNAARNDFSRRLAAAGQVWIDVLREQVDPAALTAAVTGIAEAGLAWDASRLAGFAATRCADPGAVKELLRLARSVDRMRAQSEDDGLDASNVSAVLTERELNVSRLVLQGLGYREIGQRLFISPRTVEHHVARVRRRLGATDRRDLLDQLREILD